MTAELRIGLRHWLAALAGAALVHALMIAALEAGGARGWLGTDAARRPAAAGRGLHVAVSLQPFQPSQSSQPPRPSQPSQPSQPSRHPGPADNGRSQPTRAAAAAEPATAALRSPEPQLRTPAPPREEAVPDNLPGGIPGGSSNGLRAGELAGGGESTRSGVEIEAGGSQANDYFTALYERVIGVHDYPRRAQREQIEGTVLLSIRIDRQGRVASCRVRESSGAAVLDRQAVRTVHRAAPFGAVPASTDDSELDFDLPLEYRLR